MPSTPSVRSLNRGSFEEVPRISQVKKKGLFDEATATSQVP